MEETGTLIVGIEFDGEAHKDFALRPALVRDSIEILEEAPRAEANVQYMGVCLLAKQLVKLGDIPKEKISPDLLMEMYEIDMAEITRGNERLKQRQERFRSPNEAPASADPGRDENGVHPE